MKYGGKREEPAAQTPGLARKRADDDSAAAFSHVKDVSLSHLLVDAPA